MKKLLIIILFCSTNLFAQQHTNLQLSGDKAEILAHFEEESGTVSNNVGKSSHTGTNSGMTIVNGYIGKGVDCTAKTQKVEFGTPRSAMERLTLSFWVNLDDLDPYDGVGYGALVTYYYNLGAIIVNDKLTFYSAAEYAGADTALTLNTWIHLGITWDKNTDDTIRYYYNGQPDGSTARIHAIIGNPIGNFSVLHQSLNDNRTTNGRIDEVFYSPDVCWSDGDMWRAYKGSPYVQQ